MVTLSEQYVDKAAEEKAKPLPESIGEWRDPDETLKKHNPFLTEHRGKIPATNLAEASMQELEASYDGADRQKEEEALKKKKELEQQRELEGILKEDIFGDDVADAPALEEVDQAEMEKIKQANQQQRLLDKVVADHSQPEQTEALPTAADDEPEEDLAAVYADGDRIREAQRAVSVDQVKLIIEGQADALQKREAVAGTDFEELD